MNEKERNARNLDPHDSARAAMWLFGDRYSKQGGGSMDFWDGLSRSDKTLCREMVAQLRATRSEKP